MYNVSIDGKKFSILVWSKVLGLKKRIEWFFYLFKKRVLKNGPKLHPILMVELESNVEKDGTIIWIQWLRKIPGARRKNGFFTYAIDNTETLGLISLKFWRVELTTQLKIIGIQAWEKSWLNLKRTLKASVKSTLTNVKWIILVPQRIKSNNSLKIIEWLLNRSKTKFCIKIKKQLINRTKFTMKWKPVNF